MKILKNIVLAIMLFTTLMVNAQELFKTLDARNGLTSSQINCILKDTKGFMWFGTPAGLYRYDGYRFKHFQSDSQDGSSLPDSYIETIQETLDKNLWIKTAAGYCIYHPQTETFDRDMRQEFSKLGIKNVPVVIYVDHLNNLWGFIPGKGVICYNMGQQLVYEFGYTDDYHGIPQGNVCSIGECRDGALIVYDDGTIVCCDVMHQQQTLWVNQDIARQNLRHTSSLRVFTDQRDNIWLYGQGTLFVYNRSTRTWNTTIGNELGLTGISVDYSVNDMAGDRSGNIWIATSRHGLIKSNVNTYVMEPMLLRSMDSQRLQAENTLNMAIRSLYVDNSDLLWVGTSKSGVAYLGAHIYKFEAEPLGDVSAMTQDSTGRMWYGTSDNGVIGYDGELASLKVSALAYTPDGSLWVGSKQNGLTRIKNGTVTIYSASGNHDRKTLLNDHINALCTDNSGNLWIATDGGLQAYNPRMDQFSNYTKENGKINSNNITSLFPAMGNRMLIGTSEGLSILNISTAKIKHFTGNSTNMTKFSNNYVTQVYEDTRGLLWIGTREGVNILNMSSDNLDIITEKQGLCNNNICGITEDKNKHMWITTSNGVCRVVIQRGQEEGMFNYGLYNYTQADGLLSDELNLGAIMTKDDGNVIIGGLVGINWVRAKTVDEKEALPLVILTQLYIGEEEILTGHEYDGTVPLPQALNESQRIQLKSDQNTFTIKFAAGSYNQSERLQFMYWMEGLENGWRNGDALKHGVTFTDIPSGKYKLHVKAISAEGAVSNQERVIEIIVEQPWYLQWWMLVIYGIIILGFLYMWKIGYDKVKALWRRKQAVVTELIRQREEIKAASDELRQPMSRMTSIIMTLSERESTLEEREQLNTLHSQMLQIITRVSDMQSALEHPEEKAKQLVNKNIDMIGEGEVVLADWSGSSGAELTSEIRPNADSPTAKFRVVFIDDNDDFIKFMSSRMKYVYNFHPYNDIHKAAVDIESSLPDLVVCKQDMNGMTGSELCNNIKMHPQLNKIKFVLMTDKKLSPKDMLNQNITMGADDYLAKPFNLQEAAMRFNKLLGIGPIEMDSHLIEGAETRVLEDRNSSMTTSTESNSGAIMAVNGQVTEDDQIRAVTVKSTRLQTLDSNEGTFDTGFDDSALSMTDVMDRQLINSIEQYVQQNMSRGQISLDEMATAMGMSMKPFFQKVREVTGRTPAEVVRDIRLKHACILLQRTNINMSELASNVGFVTGEYFINQFKERFGISPSEYRQRYRK